MADSSAGAVAVTGASGFVASWIVKLLLERGARVHATVRSRADRAKVAHLEELASAHPGALHLFEADLLKPGSFRTAIEGCRTVVHVASPFLTRGVRDARRELILPAVEGTRNVLQSVTEARAVDRVVLTSSLAAAYGDASDIARYPGGVVTELQWNTTSTETHQPYAYSKTLAERVAQDLARRQSAWRLVSILPGFVVGPSVSTRVDATSTDIVLQMLDGRMRSGVPDLRFAMVDVRDVARAHVEATFRREADGRYIVACGPGSLPDLAARLRERYPDNARIPRGRVPKAMLYCVGPFIGMSWRHLRNNLGIDVTLDNGASRRDLGMEYASVEQALLEQAEQLLRRTAGATGPARSTPAASSRPA